MSDENTTAVSPGTENQLPASETPANKRTAGDNNPDSDKKDAGFHILLVLMIIGTIGIAAVSIFSKNFFAVLGLSLAIALAAAICGGFLGFLFGIPRSQKKTAAGDGGFQNNTNLEEISDWLTKIIVGVSLTQLPAIGRRLHTLTQQASAGFTGDKFLNEHFSYTYAACLMVFFAVCGFFAVYLWSRIYLFEIFSVLERTLADITKTVTTQVSKEVSSRVNEAVTNSVTEVVDEKLKTEYNSRLWQTRKTEFEKQKGRIVAAEAADNVKGIVTTANPGAVTMLDDCQFKRWGEKTSAGGYEVLAEFNQVPTEPDYFKVTLTVQPIAGSGNNLTGKVYFFRHDSFYPEIIVTADAAENKAVHELVSFEAFTVGIVFNEGRNKLEINLNKYPGVPEKYTYPEDEVYSIDQIEKEIGANSTAPAPAP